MNLQDLHKKLNQHLENQSKNWSSFIYAKEKGFYQGFDEIKIDGWRPTENRFRTYDIDKYLSKEKLALDIGSNCGFFTLHVSKFVKEIDGVEINPYLTSISEDTKNFLHIPNANFHNSSFENFKTEKKFDVILNMEIVEHVEDIDFFLKSCSKLLKKNGLMFVATINKTLKSYIFAIVGAEYVLRWLPIGTHEWEKFVKPEDLKKILMKYDLSLNKLEGMNFNIIKDEWSISRDLSVNYIAKFIKN